MKRRVAKKRLQLVCCVAWSAKKRLQLVLLLLRDLQLLRWSPPPRAPHPLPAPPANPGSREAHSSGGEQLAHTNPTHQCTPRPTRT